MQQKPRRQNSKRPQSPATALPRVRDGRFRVFASVGDGSSSPGSPVAGERAATSGRIGRYRLLQQFSKRRFLGIVEGRVSDQPLTIEAISSTRPSGCMILGAWLGWTTIARSLSSKVQRSLSLSL
jgi:hypothetical protein